jgi:hypothetical protein
MNRAAHGSGASSGMSPRRCWWAQATAGASIEMPRASSRRRPAASASEAAAPRQSLALPHQPPRPTATSSRPRPSASSQGRQCCGITSCSGGMVRDPWLNARRAGQGTASCERHDAESASRCCCRHSRMALRSGALPSSPPPPHSWRGLGRRRLGRLKAGLAVRGDLVLVLAQAGQHAPFPGRDAFAELRKVGPDRPGWPTGVGGGCQAGAEQGQHQGRRCGGEMEWAHGHHGWRVVERLMVWPLGRVTTASVRLRRACHRAGCALAVGAGDRAIHLAVAPHRLTAHAAPPGGRWCWKTHRPGRG